MTATTETTVVTEPGVYDGMPDDVYHSDPVPSGSLSFSGSKLLLPPLCPAIYDHARRNGRPDKAAFDTGKAAHALALGIGAEIVVIPGERWDTKDAKAAVAAAREAEQIPLKQDVFDQVTAMADALAAHPLALALLSKGKPEQSAFWQDEETGVWLRARFDWLPDLTDSRTLLTDYKTSVSANPGEFSRSAAKYGYPQQAAWYLRGAKTLGRATDDAVFMFVVQEKTAPYPVTVIHLTDADLATGAAINRAAIDLYAKCVADDRWPAYADEPVLVACPPWYHNRILEVTSL